MMQHFTCYKPCPVQKKIKKDETITIKKMQAHRIFAKNKEVKVLEISFGTFDEKDEIRLEDKYGRTNPSK